MIFLFHFLALLLFVVTQENRKVSMRSKLWWCEVQKSGIFGLFTGWIFFSLFSGWRICIPIESGFIQPDFFFFLFRHFLVIFGIFFYISSGSNGQAGGFWCVFGIAQWGEIISKGYFGNNLTQMWDREVQNKTSRSKIWKIVLGSLKFNFAHLLFPEVMRGSTTYR